MLLCGSLFAQSVVDQLTVHLSSPVVIGETAMPAGNVNIQVLRGTSSTTLVLFRAESGVIATAVVSRIVDQDITEAGARLVFKNTGATVKLDRVLMGGHTGFQLAQ
jgi:hypothetical protein